MKTILYTAILRGSDSLKPAPPGVEAVCFVDYPSAVGDARGWIIVGHVYNGDPRREAWRLRCQSHVLFGEYDRAVWLDGSFRYVDFARLLEDAGDGELVALRHPHRSSAYEEGPALVAENRGTAEGVQRQLDAYRAEGFAPTSLSAANVLIRRHTPAVIDFNERWRVELDRWPDDNAQLSLDYCAWKAGLTVQYARGTYIDNPYVQYDQEDHRARWRPYR